MIFGEFVQNGSEGKGQMCPLQKALRLLLLSGICALSTQQMCAAGSEANVTFVPGQTLLAEIGKAPGQDHGISLMSYVRAPGYSATVVRRTRAETSAPIGFRGSRNRVTEQGENRVTGALIPPRPTRLWHGEAGIIHALSQKEDIRKAGHKSAG